MEREQQLLRRDRKRLATLDRDAAREETLRKRQAQKVRRNADSRWLDDLTDSNEQSHHLLRDSTGVSRGHHASDTQVIDGLSMETLRKDEGLQPLLRQLAHHLGSMQSNTVSIRGLGDATTRAHATLDDTLRRKGIGLSVEERNALAAIA